MTAKHGNAGCTKRTGVDRDMVRAHVVRHPREWRHGDFHEIQVTLERYRIIDIEWLCQLFGFSNQTSLRSAHLEWIDEALRQPNLPREPEWTEVVATGQSELLGSIKHEIQASNPGRPLSSVRPDTQSMFARDASTL